MGQTSIGCLFSFLFPSSLFLLVKIGDTFFKFLDFYLREKKNCNLLLFLLLKNRLNDVMNVLFINFLLSDKKKRKKRKNINLTC